MTHRQLWLPQHYLEIFPKSLTADACLAALWHVVIIVVTWIISDIFRVVMTNKTGQNVSLFLNLVSNGDVKADLNGQSISFFPEDFMHSGNQIAELKEGL